jgi:ABC-type lipoprotein release transport system permease subunit
LLHGFEGVQARVAQARSMTYEPSKARQGPVLSAAILLQDEAKSDAMIPLLAASAKAAGEPLRIVDWRAVTGALGQFLVLMEGVLLAIVGVLFLVGVIVINSALVMATLNRVKEIGALRAIGMRRHLVVTLVTLESLLIGVCFGGIGTLLGALGVAALGHTGIPSRGAVMSFFFSGSRLFPPLTPEDLLLPMVFVTCASVLSSLFPAVLAIRVSPREAMASAE